jgi:uncharacterized protein YjbI with pentapeptide repeats
MPVPTDEQIQQWRDRWKNFNTLPNVIAWILRGGPPYDPHPPKTGEEAASRMWRVNDVLRNGDFEVYEGEGEEAFVIDDFVQFPILDLSGIEWNLSFLNNIFLLDSHLEGAYLRGSHLESADLSHSHLEGADLTWSVMECTNLWYSHLEGADLSRSHLEGAHLCHSHLEGTELVEMHIEGAKLINSEMGIIERFDEDCILLEVSRNELIGRKTKFAYTEFIPMWRDFFTVKFNGLNLISFLKGVICQDFWGFNTARWFYTNFEGVRIEDADTVQAADLRRYVNDQQYLEQFNISHLRLSYKKSQMCPLG